MEADTLDLIARGIIVYWVIVTLAASIWLLWACFKGEYHGQGKEAASIIKDLGKDFTDDGRIRKGHEEEREEREFHS